MFLQKVVIVSDLHDTRLCQEPLCNCLVTLCIQTDCLGKNGPVGDMTDEGMHLALPQGHLAMIVIRNIHRHPDYWEAPEEFKPERFLPENKASLNRSAYMPFLSGPHMCIGNHFALIEGQLLLAMMAQKVDLHESPMQSDEGKMAITMRPMWVTGNNHSKKIVNHFTDWHGIKQPTRCSRSALCLAYWRPQFHAKRP